MSEYAKNIQTIEDMWKKRIELREEGCGRMSEYIITDKQMGLIQDFATVCVEGEKLPRIVRCRDCAYICNHRYANGLEWHTCGFFDSRFAEVEPDGFCAWAERREP